MGWGSNEARMGACEYKTDQPSLTSDGGRQGRAHARGGEVPGTSVTQTVVESVGRGSLARGTQLRYPLPPPNPRALAHKRRTLIECPSRPPVAQLARPDDTRRALDPEYANTRTASPQDDGARSFARSIALALTPRDARPRLQPSPRSHAGLLAPARSTRTLVNRPPSLAGRGHCSSRVVAAAAASKLD